MAFPSVAVNKNGDALLGYSRFGASQYASANYSFRAGGDPLGAMRNDNILKSGEASYFKITTGIQNRWGDFSTSTVDPANDLDLWTIQEYAMAPQGGTDRWGTWWGRIVPEAPVGGEIAANSGFSPATPVVGQVVSFTDTSTGSPTFWYWTFGDGGSSASQSPTHAFASVGIYGVTLTASNSSGFNQLTKAVTVVAAAIASFTFSPASPIVGQTVGFSDTSTGFPTSWFWSFGDGATSAAQNPSHAYAAVGVYGVTLTVSNTSGFRQVTKPVTVLAAPTPARQPRRVPFR